MNDGGNMRPLEFTHFGAAGWKITDGETVILLDPYLSRVRFQGRKYGPHDATDIARRHRVEPDARRDGQTVS